MSTAGQPELAPPLLEGGEAAAPQSPGGLSETHGVTGGTMFSKAYLYTFENPSLIRMKATEHPIYKTKPQMALTHLHS